MSAVWHGVVSHSSRGRVFAAAGAPASILL